MSIWITYDPGGAFPQVPRIEGRFNKPKNVHTPPGGLASFEVDEADLEHGARSDEIRAFYRVTAPDTLAALASPEIDTIRTAQAKPIALARIDNAAGEARARFITTAPGQESVYAMKREHATAYKAAGYTGEVPAMVAAEAQAQGIAAQEATDFILATAAKWIMIAAVIEQHRQSGKTAIKAATTIETVETILADTVSALNQIKPE